MLHRRSHWRLGTPPRAAPRGLTGAARKIRSMPASSVARAQSAASSTVRSGVMTPTPPRWARALAKRVSPVLLDRVPVRHHHDRCTSGGGAGHDIEDGLGGGPAGQRDLGRPLDDRPVHQRIGVRQAHLDDVDPVLDHRRDQGHRVRHAGEPGRQVPDQRCPVLCLGCSEGLMQQTHSAALLDLGILGIARADRSTALPSPRPCRPGPTGSPRSRHRGRARGPAASHRRGRARIRWRG